MESNLQHEDLLIKLRGKLNDEKIKLWEPPFIDSNNALSESLKELAKKYADILSLDPDMALNALRELQLHSMERVKANDEFKETGLATFRIKVTVSKDKPEMLKIQKMLNVLGSDLISAVATEMKVEVSRVKLISNGKIVKPNLTLMEQNIKNGSLLMALLLDTTPEEVKKEDDRYMQMKTTRDDATLLSDYVNEVTDDDEYITLEDQSGKTVEIPKAERKSLLVGMALHERGRTAIKQQDYSLALILLLEADRQFNECRSSLLQSVDNWGILQLDIAWCYAGLRSVGGAADAATRLRDAERALNNSYGSDRGRLMAVKGNAANERVLLMRLYLLQGIVAFHQNRRAEAKSLLEKAESELNYLRVDEEAVSRLMELGWSRTQARLGLRGAAGDPDRAHMQLAALAEQRAKARERHRRERRHKLLGQCIDGTPVDPNLVQSLTEMGFGRKKAVRALRQANNNVDDAVTMLQQSSELLEDSLGSESSSGSLEDGPSGEIDKKLVAELESMGYNIEEVKKILKLCNYHVQTAVDVLMSRDDPYSDDDATKPSTSTAEAAARSKLKEEREKKRLERDQALQRLSSAIRSEEDDYLDTSLMEEEQYLAEYKSLL